MSTLHPEAQPASPPPVERWQPRGKIMMVIRLLGGRAGGAERLFCDTANMFATAGYDVLVAYCDASGESPPYRFSDKVARVNLWAKASRLTPLYRLLDRLARGYDKTHRWRAPADWFAKNLYFTRRLFVVANESRPDVMISFMPPANTPTLIAGLLAGVPVIPTNHNVPVQDYESNTRWDQNPIDRALRLWMLYSAARVHVLFPTFATWFPPGIRKKVVPLANPVSPEFMVPQAPRPRRKDVIGVGRLAVVKNYIVLVEAWAKIARQHPDWNVRIYGPGPQRAILNQRIKDLGVAHCIHLMGQENNVRDVYHESEIMCHPALFEGFGLSVAEALACGLPVVAFSDCPGVNEFVHDGENGLLADRAGGADALAACLDRLIRDEDLRAALRQRAPESIRSYSIEAFRDRWTHLVEQVMAVRS